MGIKSKVESGDYLKAEGSFTARIVNLEEQEGSFKDNVVRLTCEVLDDEKHDGQLVTGLTSVKVTPSNKTAIWIKGFDPSFEPEIGEVFDWDILKGKIGRILVEEKGEYHNIVKVRPLKPEEQESLNKYLEKLSAKPKEEKPESKPEKKAEEKKKKPADDDIDF